MIWGINDSTVYFQVAENETDLSSGRSDSDSMGGDETETEAKDEDNFEGGRMSMSSEGNDDLERSGVPDSSDSGSLMGFDSLEVQVAYALLQLSMSPCRPFGVGSSSTSDDEEAAKGGYEHAQMALLSSEGYMAEKSES